MIKIGDTVKVISATMHQGERKEFIPIGTICRVTGVECSEEGAIVSLLPQNAIPYDCFAEYWYLESEVEKGHMEWVKENDEKKCYVLTCHCYSGDDSISVFWDKTDAYKTMIEELETEIANLQREGYSPNSSENDDSAEIYVPDSGIFFGWNIKESREATDEEVELWSKDHTTVKF